MKVAPSAAADFTPEVRLIALLLEGTVGLEDLLLALMGRLSGEVEPHDDPQKKPGTRLRFL
ncbi:MAG: hypothetical protein HY319_08110 [Armatimonadetes bacterium]|nr:hypothetical protein [Armatimonadota bacterium]